MKRLFSLATLCISFFGFTLGSRALASWKKEGPFILTELGSIELLISQQDAAKIQVTLMDADEKTIETGSAIDRMIHFRMLDAGTYYIYVHTDGLDDLKIYTQTNTFQSIDR